MEITEALITKFFDDACTPEEADIVSRYFEENPAALKRWLGSDWKEAGRGGKGISRRMIIGWAAAAVILLVAGLGLLHLRQKEEGAFAVRRKDAVLGEATWKWQVRFNQSSGRERVVLPDGSVVSLFAQGKIIYKDPFPADKREITLEGQASFNVVKETAKPFTVKAGTTITTVLGTCFNVQENEQGVIVQLFRGKVSVRAVLKEFVLSPGQQVKVEAGKDTGEVSLFRKEIPETPAKNAAAIHDNKEVLVFDHTPLPEVMEKLMGRYRVVVQYDEKELNKMYFTGSVLYSDSLSTLLRGIANINDLKITRKESGFMVSVSPY